MQTVLANEKGRIVDVLTIVPLPNDTIRVLCHSRAADRTREWLDKFIIMENITITDVSSDYVQFLLFDLDPRDEDVLRKHIDTTSTLFEFLSGFPRVFRLAGRQDSTEQLTDVLTSCGVKLASANDFEEFRVSKGIPETGAELTDQYNPLAAGLSNLISWTKGCYIGQEVIARLDTYKKVQRRLVALELDSLPIAPAALLDEVGDAGTITSCVQNATDGICRGLGYIKSASLERQANCYFLRDGEKHFVKIADRGA